MTTPIRTFLILLIISLWSNLAMGQCKPYFVSPKSERPVKYSIQLVYDEKNHSAQVKQRISWRNISSDTISFIPFYTYLNAFKNIESSYIKEARANIFGQDLTKRSADTWGWIDIDKTIQEGVDITEDIYYYQPDDDNEQDQSVLKVPLNEHILPGDSTEIYMEYVAKLPKTISRAGYSRDGFAFWNHWFPQPGVLEQDRQGQWDWNCHQFHQRTEFFGEFSVFDVELTCADHLVLGATGCKVAESKNTDNQITYQYHAEDVIDFAWGVYPDFCVIEDQWEHVYIKVLIPSEHAYLADRYVTALKQSLEYLTEHVGPYEYPCITLMDPPLHGLRSGLMEYPTFITGGTFFGIPKDLRSMESLAIHEFTHQYFMAMVASNEKEEAWMDEGFVTYFEDRILDHYYGDKCSYYDLLGYRTGNAEKSRLEFTGLSNPNIDYAGKPGWEIKGAYKELVYAKTATMLKTMEGILGQEDMDYLIQKYFNRWKFKHPKGYDLEVIIKEAVLERKGKEQADEILDLFRNVIYGTDHIDYSVRYAYSTKDLQGLGLFGEKRDDFEFKEAGRAELYRSEVVLQRRGELIIPVEIKMTFEDGTELMEYWNGKERQKKYTYNKPIRITSVHIDPEQKIYLDLDLNNNSFTWKPERAALWKYALKSITWVQNMMQSATFIF